MIEYEGKRASSNLEKSNLFASFFQTVFADHPADPDLNSFIDHRTERNCKNIIINTENVAAVLSRMNISKGNGHDGVSSFFLRECSRCIALPLGTIFTKSLNMGYYPKLFKIGQITPIYKSGKRSEATN